ncbi:MAG: hypothetical protein ABSD02_07080 [Steroidobacteraceae bacterium]|jgi:hypothetical protein
MSEVAAPIDDATMKFGLLMESAQTHQKLAETHLERLRAHTEDLDDVVREEIRRTLAEELAELTAESSRAAAALRRMKRAADLRGHLWAAALALVATAIPAAFMHWALPSTSEIDSLRGRRDQLQANLKKLEQMGGRAEWRRCGDSARFCVRIDKSAPAYGEKGDYFVVKGY